MKRPKVDLVMLWDEPKGPAGLGDDKKVCKVRLG